MTNCHNANLHSFSCCFDVGGGECYLTEIQISHTVGVQMDCDMVTVKNIVCDNTTCAFPRVAHSVDKNILHHMKQSYSHVLWRHIIWRNCSWRIMNCLWSSVVLGFRTQICHMYCLNIWWSCTLAWSISYKHALKHLSIFLILLLYTVLSKSLATPWKITFWWFF